MGEEDERERRLRDFAGFGIDTDLLAAAADDSIVLHCLPAHIGEEISGDVLYGGQSAVWQQAENRLHVQKALLALLLKPDLRGRRRGAGRRPRARVEAVRIGVGRHERRRDCENRCDLHAPELSAA